MAPPPDALPPCSLHPIGTVRSPFATRQEAPRQPAAARGVQGRIELLPSGEMRDAIDGIEQWSHLWVVFLFDRNEGWKAKVAPPRSDRKLGVLATRAPYRPNPIGLSLVRLRRVEGHTLHVCDLDILDGSPVLDIKPYVAYSDTAPDSTDGWLKAPQDPGRDVTVRFTERATQQLDWLADRDCAWLRTQAVATLRLGGAPHAYRRIRSDGDAMRIAIKDFRLRFLTRDEGIEVLSVHSGYKRRYLARDGALPRAETPLQVHRDFMDAFG